MVLLWISCLLHLSSATEYDHKYAVGDPVMLWVNKVGPYNNPQETYNYYSLPFCKPGKADAHHKWGGLGDILQGNELIDSQIEIKFQKTIEKATICSLELDAEKTFIFRDAVAKLFQFKFFMDDLPLWGFVGEHDPWKFVEDAKYVICTHTDFVIKYNKDQIIQVNLTQGNLQPIKAGSSVELTYAVKWVETHTAFPGHFDVYLDYPFFETQVPYVNKSLTPPDIYCAAINLILASSNKLKG